MKRLAPLVLALVGISGCAGAEVLGRGAEPTATTVGTDTAPPLETTLRRRTWRDPGKRIAVRVPVGWSIKPGRPLPDPSVCFELTSAPRAGAPARTSRPIPPDGVEVRMVEFVGAPRGPETRPKRLDLDAAAPAASVGWTEGRVLAFRERNRSVALGFVVGPAATPATVSAVEDVVNSVVLERGGRCGPEPIRWRRSRALGLPWAGRLVNGVQLPAEGEHFFTWDPVRLRRPDRPGRRWGADGVVRRTLRIVEAYARAHPDAPRVGIGDFSRRRGGDFGPKHVSHQNGLDVDVYYPRIDGRERPARWFTQVDRRLAQDLVDRFVAAGAAKVFVGPNVGPRGVVEVLPNHDDHLHARFPKRLA